jgi:hypothetical protein
MDQGQSPQIPERIQVALDAIFKPEAGRKWYYQTPVPILCGATPDSVASCGLEGEEAVLGVLWKLAGMHIGEKVG